MAGKQSTTQEERFWAKVLKTESCWLWQGALTSRGYGQIDGGVRSVHRFAWQLIHGDIPNGLLVCHRCDVPRCVNPDHLFLGTNSDNMRDCVAKGRHNKPRGIDHWKHKLTAEAVVAIRNNRASSRQIAKAHGVSQRTVIRIKHRELWKHLP